MSVALLHILVMGFILVLVLETLPAEWWSNGVSECRAFSNWIRLVTLSARTR